MATKELFLEDGWRMFNPRLAERLSKENSILWAMSYGFADTDGMKESGKQMERERLAEPASNKGADE